MDLQCHGASEEILGSLNGCLVEGDAEQLRRSHKRRRRALLFSVLVQILVVVAIVLFPLLSRGERISLPERWTIVPPYGPSGPARHNVRQTHPQGGDKRVCIVCFNSSNLPSAPRASEPIGDNSNTSGNDLIPGAPERPGIPGGSLTSDRGPRKPDEETEHNVRSRIFVGHIEPALLIYRVEPRYPPLAVQLRHEGRVELRAIIATSGAIQSLEVVSGDPLFYQSALEAVRQWRYRATVLNGTAVEVDTHITVIYSLNR